MSPVRQNIRKKVRGKSSRRIEEDGAFGEKAIFTPQQVSEAAKKSKSKMNLKLI